MAICLKHIMRYACVCVLLVLYAQVANSQDASTSLPSNDNAIGETIDSGVNAVIPEEELFFEDQDNQNIDVQTIGIVDVLRIFLVLIFILAVAIGLVWFLKKIQNNQQNTNSEVIDIISTRALTQSSSLHVVKVARGYILIANSGQSVNLIKEYVDKEDIDEIQLSISQVEADAQNVESDSFIKKLQKRLSLQSNVMLHQDIGNMKSNNKNNSLLSAFIDKNSIFGKGNK